MPKRRLMSGMRPTGKLHLGHLLGVLLNWKRLQEEYDCYYSIVDWHALTTEYRNTSEIPESIREMVLDWLACGIDPDKSTLYIQSHVPEIAELHLLLSMMIPVAWLERVPTYKQQLDELVRERLKLPEERSKDGQLSPGDMTPGYEAANKIIISGYSRQNILEREGRAEAARSRELEYLATYGFLGYPLLQAADILAMKGEVVPVGQDQLPHLELAREIVRRAHHILKQEIFPEPQALLSAAPFVPGTDGRKMSKSYNNGIFLSDTPEAIREKIKMTITDRNKIRKGDPGRPEVCNIFFYHKFFSPEPVVSEVERTCRSGELGCVADKNQFATLLIEKLAPIREQRARLSENKKYLLEILDEGAKKARVTARKALDELKEAMHLTF